MEVFNPSILPSNVRRCTTCTMLPLTLITESTARRTIVVGCHGFHAITERVVYISDDVIPQESTVTNRN